MDSRSLLKSLCFGMFCCYNFVVFVDGNSVYIPPSLSVHGNDIFADILDRVMELEERDSKLSNRVAMLEDENHEQRMVIDGMKKVLSDYQKTNIGMTKQLTKTKHKIVKLETSIRALKKNGNKKLDQLKIKLLSRPRHYQEETKRPATEMTTDTEDTTTMIKDESTPPNDVAKKRIRRMEVETKVAFFAKVANHIFHEGKNQNIVFEVVETNIGNAYNHHHGVFVAPVSGTYVFSSSVTAYDNREVWCHFAVNSINNGNIYARGTDGKNDQGSLSIIVRLQQGDDVSVQNELADDTIHGNGYSAFSGFLLYEGFTSNQIVG